MVIEVYESNGMTYTKDINGLEICLNYTPSMFVDVSLEQTEAKIKSLKQLVELGFDSDQIIELKKQGLL